MFETKTRLKNQKIKTLTDIDMENHISWVPINLALRIDIQGSIDNSLTGSDNDLIILLY